jgi:hypothetical protein
MRVEVTEHAVFVLELTEEDRQHLEHALRRTGGKSLIITRKPLRWQTVGEEEQLRALIESFRTSAQDTLAALRRRGYRLVRCEEP